jgi:hypothetical protein
MGIAELIVLILFISATYAYLLIHLENALDRLRLEVEEVREIIVKIAENRD